MLQGLLSLLELEIKKAPILVMIYTFFPAFDFNSHFAFLITIRILPSWLNALSYFRSTYKLYLVLCAVFVVRECRFGGINIGDINIFSTWNIVFDALIRPLVI